MIAYEKPPFVVVEDGFEADSGPVGVCDISAGVGFAYGVGDAVYVGSISVVVCGFSGFVGLFYSQSGAVVEFAGFGVVGVGYFE